MMRVLAFILAALLQLGPGAWAGQPGRGADIPEIEVQAAGEEIAGTRFAVFIDGRAAVGIERTPYWLLFAAGGMAVPLALLDPVYVFGTLIPVIGTPMNALLESDTKVLVRAVAAEPLPAAVMDALRAQLAQAPVAAPPRVDIAIGGYGLVPSSGKPSSHLFDAADEMCLVAHVVVTTQDAPDAVMRETRLPLGLAEQASGAPPPLCAGVRRLAAQDGRLLRQAIRELGEVIAALALQTVEAKR